MRKKPSVNPYYTPSTKPEKNPDKVIIPAWVLSSFFEDYGATEIEYLRARPASLVVMRCCNTNVASRRCTVVC